MNSPPRALPLRVPIQPGEALDSWLIRLAGRNGTALQRIAPALGLAEQARNWRRFAWVKHLPDARLRTLERQVGLADGVLDGAVLDQFDPLGWQPIAGSRYCVECLRASGGIWPIRWQLPYTFACLDHARLLAAVCPACGLIPHRRLTQQAGALPSHYCTSKGRSEGYCRADLLEVEPTPLTRKDPRASTQAWINDRLDRMDAAAVTDLRDLDTLAWWFRARVFPSDVADLDAETIRVITDVRNPHLHLSLRREHPATVVLDAAVAHLAVGILTADEAETRYRRFMPLFRDVGTATGDRRASLAPKMLSHQRLARLSVSRQQELLAACDRRLPVSERLRYYTATPSPRLPDAADGAAERARWIPRRLWQDWLVRFAPAKGAHATAIAVDIPAALMLPGNPIRNIEATRELSRWRVSSANTLTEIARTYPDVLEAICNLADYLQANGGPIDYRRRRATFTDVDLSEAAWLELCARLGTRPGFGRRLQFVRLHLFALLTGDDILTATTLPTDPDEQTRQTYNSYFKHRIHVRLRAALTDYAASLLAAAGIDEPVTWSPPADCVAGLRLPGPAPDSLSPDDLTDCLEHQRLSATATAARLGTTIEHVRYLLERRDPVSYKRKSRPARRARSQPVSTPDPQPEPSESSPERFWRSAAFLLDRDFLEEHLVHQAKSTRQVASETGFSIGTIRKYAKRHGLKSACKQQYAKKVPIDPDWFRHQTEVLNRPNTEIAAELGISGETLRKRRLELDIQPNRSGIYHHRRFPDLPADIRSAVEGQQDGWTRLYRFQQTMAFPSMNIAAKQLGYYTSNLNLQINRLERDIGAKLIERGHRYQPMQPTPRGRRLLDDLATEEVHALLDRYAHKTRIDKPNRRRPTKSRPT